MRTTIGIAASLLLSTQTVFAGSLAPPVVEQDVVVVEEGPAGTLGMGGGLGTAGAVAGGLLLVGALAAIAGDDDDDDDDDVSTTTTVVEVGD